jgi:hypothetical protein
MQSAPFNIPASQTDAVLIAGVSAKRVIVFGLFLTGGPTPTSITFNSNEAGPGFGTPISCTFQLGAYGGTVIPPNAGLDGWFKTNLGEGLTCTTGAGSTTGIQLLYDVQ